MKLGTILKEVGDSVWELAGFNPQIVQQMADQSADWLRRYTVPGTKPIDAVEEWLGRMPWNEMKEMWRGLSHHQQSELARFLVMKNTRTSTRPSIFGRRSMEQEEVHDARWNNLTGQEFIDLIEELSAEYHEHVLNDPEMGEQTMNFADWIANYTEYLNQNV
jgi:hypothetical protein